MSRSHDESAMVSETLQLVKQLNQLEQFLESYQEELFAQMYKGINPFDAMYIENAMDILLRSDKIKEILWQKSLEKVIVLHLDPALVTLFNTFEQELTEAYQDILTMQQSQFTL